MIMPIQPIDPFTPAAARRWGKIPQDVQQRILANVWCGSCVDSVQIVIETAVMEGKYLLLNGRCKTCGKDVCRVVEPENG